MLNEGVPDDSHNRSLSILSVRLSSTSAEGLTRALSSPSPLFSLSVYLCCESPVLLQEITV
ncbi:unnamed protein product [Tenebrio molitor]|nr:unnamed protein product [Tenebrio molitor]